MNKRPPKILIDDRWIGDHGIGRFAREIISRTPGYISLRKVCKDIELFHISWLDNQLTQIDHDVYFSPGFNPPRKSPKPFIFCIHDLIHLDVKSERSFSKKLFYGVVVKRAVFNAFKVITVSEFSKKRIVEWSGVEPEKIVVVSNGVSKGFKSYGGKYDKYSIEIPLSDSCESKTESRPKILSVEERPYLLFVGNAKPHKNLRRTLEAFKISKTAEECDLLIVAEEDRKIEKLIRKCDLVDKAVITGTVSEIKLQKIYRGAQICLFPSLYEGFGLPALEAMASGIPLLASNFPAVIEVTKGAAYYVDEYSVESIAAGIDRLYEDKRLRKELKAKGIKRSKSFSWEKTYQTVMGVILDALK